MKNFLIMVQNLVILGGVYHIIFDLHRSKWWLLALLLCDGWEKSKKVALRSKDNYIDVEAE